MGYVLLLSIGYRVYPSVLTGKLINAIASTLSIIFLYLIGSKLINQQAGLIASFLFSLLPNEILMVSVLGTEVTVTALGIIIAFFIARSIGDKLSLSSVWIFWAGLFFGLCLTIRSSFIFYSPAIFLLIIFAVSPNYRQMMRIYLAFFVGIVVGLGLILMSYFIFTKSISVKIFMTQDSFPFLSGTNIAKSGTWNKDDANLYYSWPWDKRDALARQEAINRIKSNLIRFIFLLIPKKIAILMAENDYGSIWSLHNVNWGIGKILVRMLSQSVYVSILFLDFRAFKEFDSRKRTVPSIVLILVLFTLLPHVVLEVQGRYHHSIMPFLVLLASNIQTKQLSELELSLIYRP